MKIPIWCRASALLLIAGCMIVCCCTALYAEEITIKEISDFIDGYNEHPQPEKAIPMLEALLRSPDQRIFSDAVAHFFAAVIHTDKSLIEQLKNLQSSYFGRELELIQKTIREAENYSSSLTAKTPVGVDMLWAEYSATGNEEAVKRVIGCLVAPDNADEQQMINAGAARWSLMHMAQRHKQVYAVCKAQIPQVDEETKAILEAVVNDAAAATQ
jgi:hypothetical protein